MPTPGVTGTVVNTATALGEPPTPLASVERIQFDGSGLAKTADPVVNEVINEFVLTFLKKRIDSKIKFEVALPDLADSAEAQKQKEGRIAALGSAIHTTGLDQRAYKVE